MYETLQLLAAERSDEKRAELLFQLTDMFRVKPEDYTAKASHLLREILVDIVDAVSEDWRQSIAREVAGDASVPRELAVRLASDSDAGTAAPVIQRSTLLTEDDLVGIARAGSQGHLEAIATRPAVSERVTDILIDRGNERVIHTVSRNTTASFSTGGMAKLLDKASSDVELQALLVSRRDLRPPELQKLMANLADSVVAEVVGAGQVPPVGPDGLEASVRAALLGAFADRRAKLRQANEFADQVRDGTATLAESLRRLIALQRLYEAAALIAKVGGLDAEMVFSSIARDSTGQVMLLFRALDLPADVLVEMVELRKRKGLAVTTEPASVLVRTFDNIDPKVARRVIRALKVRAVMDLEDAAIAS